MTGDSFDHLVASQVPDATVHGRVLEDLFICLNSNTAVEGIEPSTRDRFENRECPYCDEVIQLRATTLSRPDVEPFEEPESKSFLERFIP